ncbi:tail protein X [Bacillus solitudinis]|uniref:tail protein X n=1 Tax=Bacillus solitudinis TaxID=2014074 RepID=UPI0018E27479|nr:tail protein X [Bacillus solitudinis]
MNYSTVSGDTFDKIAFEQYGDEKLALQIIEANIEHASVLTFGSGTELTIPDVEVTPISNLPPWKRGES